MPDREDRAQQGEEEAFESLVLRYLDETTSPDEEGDLDGRLQTSPTDRKRFVEVCRQVSLLREVFASELPPPGAGSEVGSAGLVPPSSTPILGFLGEAFQRGCDALMRPYPFVVLIGVVLGLPLLALVVMLLTSETPSQPSGGLGPIVARLNCHTIDARWGESSEKVQVGAYLRQGQRVELAAGLAELGFESGATVLLEGPAAITLDGENSLSLRSGRLTGLVRPGAEGFLVKTDSLTVTDLGTEFGVVVAKDGSGEVVVFDGTVAVAAASVRDVAQRRATITEGDGLRYDQPNGQLVRVPPGELGSFARNIRRPLPIPLFSTGRRLAEGQVDPHWQLVALDGDVFRAPCPAIVARMDDGLVGNAWLANEPEVSQWISSAPAPQTCRSGGRFTFRTTFDLTGLVPSTAQVMAHFIGDNYVAAVRLNGQPVSIPEQGQDAPFTGFSSLVIDSGFVEGLNTLEVVVQNALQTTPNPMGLRMELTGTAEGQIVGQPEADRRPEK